MITLESLSNSGPRNIHQIPFFEQFIKHKPLIGLKPLHTLQSELLQMSQRNNPTFFQVPHLRLSQLPVPDAAITHLNRDVPISSLCLHLSDNVALSKPNYRDGDNLPGRLEIRHHAELGPHYADAGFKGGNDLLRHRRGLREREGSKNGGFVGWDERRAEVDGVSMGIGTGGYEAERSKGGGEGRYGHG